MHSHYPALLLAGILCAGTAQALIVEGDESASTTAPADDFGFANVGIVRDSTAGADASGIYLGNGWMISAYHVVTDGSGGFLFGNVTLNGISYSVDPNSGVRLQTAAQTPADLALFHLTTIPVGLSSITISGSDPATGASLIMAAGGHDRDSAETHWNVNTSSSTWTWTETAGLGNAQGYKWLTTQTLRWGTNNIAGYTSNVDDGFGITNTLQTDFTSGVAKEAQAANGDSGGGIFYKSGGVWELQGIILTEATFNNQPANTSVYGDATYAADLSTYKSQIDSVIPEPGAGPLVAGGMLLLAGRRRVRQA